MLSILLELLLGLGLVSILYVLNMKYNYKSKLLDLLVTVDAYNFVIILTNIIIINAYSIITENGSTFRGNPLVFSGLICSYYLLKLPKQQH